MSIFLTGIALTLVAVQSTPPAPSPPPDWDLTPIFANAAAAAHERAAIAAALPGLARWQGKLTDAATIRAVLEARSALKARAQRVYIWANLRLSRDGSDPAAGTDQAAANVLWAQLETATAYLEPELVALGDARLATLAADPALAPYRRVLDQLRERAAHVLPAEQEALLAGAQPLVRSAATVRDVLFNVELPFPTVTVDGRPQQLNAMTLRQALADPDRASRRAAWEADKAILDQYKGTQAALMQAYFAGIAWEAKVRRWPGQTAMVTASDPMPAPAFAALGAEAERAAKGPLARYLALKARALGLPALAGYDLNAPLRADTRRFTIDQAKAETLAAVAPLGRDYQQRLARGLAGKWIDWHPLPAKAPGGLTLYGPADLPAYIAVTFNGNAAGLAIVAHEFGHWVHWDYARGSGAPWESLAPAVSSGDVAPFVHEMLVADRQIATATTRDARIVALTSAIEALRGPYYGVVPGAAFDLAVRAAADADTPLTPDLVSRLYCDARKRYAPPGIAWDQRDCLGWVIEPYVYYDLYFYRYLLATSAAAWFAERIATGDPAIVSRLTAFLRAGGTAPTTELLARAGFDAADPASYAPMTRRLERLTAALERQIGAPQ